MTFLRKEQLNDVQAKFSLPDVRLYTTDAASPVLGFEQTTSFVPPGGPFNPYTVFLGSSVTGVFGGAVEDSSGFYTGTLQSPFVAASGQSFSITVPQLNSGNPISITLLTGDIVNIDLLSFG